MSESDNDTIQVLLKTHGFDVSKYNESFLSKSIQKRIAETQCKTTEEYYDFLEENHNEGELFYNSLHNSFSEFFRNPLTFALLERTILPSLILRKKRTKHSEIRIWSAACAGGQEVYSLAMLLEEIRDRDKDKFKYRIFATDQCDLQVKEAKEGRYPTDEINNLRIKQLNSWFAKYENTYTIKKALKKNITFSIFDLFDEQLSCPAESIFGEFDIIICANLLFYYKKEYQKKILDKVSNSLARGGYLVTGEAEREILMNENYREVIPQSGIFQR